MSADLLRRAANLMRQEADLVATPWLHGVAGFLEAIASRNTSGNDLRWPHPEDAEWAAQIARAYLGESA